MNYLDLGGLMHLLEKIEERYAKKGEGSVPTFVIGTVTTGDAGSEADVDIVQSGNTVTLNFSIPKGDTGSRGATGATGPNALSSSTTDNLSTTTSASTYDYVVVSSGSSFREMLASYLTAGKADSVKVSDSGQTYTLAGFTSAGTGYKELMTMNVSELPKVPNAEYADTAGKSNGATFYLTESYTGDYGIRTTKTQQTHLVAGDQYMSFEAISGYWYWFEKLDGLCYLGRSSQRFVGLYAQNGSIITSDRDKKDNIKSLSEDDRYLKLFYKLKPVSYTFKNLKETDNHDRVHTGFIAQEIEESMSELGMGANELAAFCKDPKRDENDEVIEGEYDYSLRYEELISLNTLAIQSLKAENDALKERVSALEEAIASLKK